VHRSPRVRMHRSPRVYARRSPRVHAAGASQAATMAVSDSGRSHRLISFRDERHNRDGSVRADQEHALTPSGRTSRNRCRGLCSQPSVRTAGHFFCPERDRPSAGRQGPIAFLDRTNSPERKGDAPARPKAGVRVGGGDRCRFDPRARAGNALRENRGLDGASSWPAWL
jgi:hypothetical protein